MVCILALACAGVLVLPLASALLPNWRVAAWPSLGAPVPVNAEPVEPALRPGSNHVQELEPPARASAPAVSVAASDAGHAAAPANDAVTIATCTSAVGCCVSRIV